MIVNIDMLALLSRAKPIGLRAWTDSVDISLLC